MSEPPFSARTAWDTGESALTAAVRALRAEGRSLVDLTASNPTGCGFDYDAEALLGPLTDPAALLYAPEPLGMEPARRAVVRYYAEHGAALDPARLVLTTSTSEAYSFLFRLLCDAGDDVLVATPGYPLFDFLATLDDVRLRTYPLFYDFGWWIDWAELERRIGPRTRAILLVHPNNPTGHTTRGAERERLQKLCAERGLALVVDEVFLDYGRGQRVESFARGPHPGLTFVLSGLSKIAALPQMKVAWLAAWGPARLAEEAMSRLEVIADTMLSLNAPAQCALPAWLASREALAGQIRRRIEENLRVFAEGPWEVLPVEAGWSVVLRLPVALADDGIALAREAGVLVHPGSFYGLAGRNRVVVSGIVRREDVRSGVKKLREWIESKEST